jgi:L-lactate dehydrogenase complex protein LldE
MLDPLSSRPRVGLFVTCLVDLMRPSIAFAAAKLIEASGCEVIVPGRQTCCGQPAYNAGSAADAADLARRAIAAFDGLDFVVAPSGSCAGMLKRHYPELLRDDPVWHGRALAFAERVHELTAFLVDVRRLDGVPGRLVARATYHDSCSGLRELEVKRQPRELLSKVEGLQLVEMADCEVCCGFGGMFSVRYPDISNAVVERKVDRAAAADGAELLLSGDLGCLLNMAGKLSRTQSALAVRHVAEVLAGELSDPPIGRPG